ncbi:mucosal addressin cell adhesion molecule 1 isoform X2 [Aquarana catesbeiana]|uniref:mucosal addressin cell adhesion molecule 1 isoform X2 n=1 Tax=Aquarana catesbeiana TaxID=8400 RepID=UPI003CC93EEB
MAPSVICCTLLQLFLLVSANDILTIDPQNPIVPLGGSIKLNCSINNPSCTTNWKGLDTNLGSVYTAPGYSVLTIQNASISMEGTKICVTTCPAPGRSKNLQKSVSLQVYALPETLLLSTSTTNSNSYLHCLMKGMHPMVDIDVQCYRNSDKLGSYSDDITSDDELDIHNITWSWEISDEDLKSQTLYKCEAGLSIGERIFRRVGILAIPKEVGTTDTLARTVTDTENQNTAMTTRTPKTFSTTTDPTTLYTRTPKKWTPSPPSTSSRVTTHKQFPTSNTVRATDALDTTITNTENQNTSMTTFSTSTDSTTVYTETPKQKTPSPLSTTTVYTETPKQKTPSPLSTSTVYTETPKQKTPSPLSTTTVYTETPKQKTPSPLSTTTVYTETPKQKTPSPLSTTTVYTETPKQKIPSPLSTTTVYTETPKQKTPSPLSTTTVYTETPKQKTPSPLSTTTVYTETPKQKTPSPLSTMFSSLIPRKELYTPNTDDMSIIWMAVPAAGLAGSILLFLQIWRQLNKKGFFQPNQIHWSDCKHGAKDLAYSLETGSSHYRSVK